MTNSVECPECFRLYQLADDKAGKKFRCKACEAVVTVPFPETPFGPPINEDEDDDDFGGGLPTSRTRRKKKRRSSRGNSGKGSVVAIIIMVLAAFHFLVSLILNTITLLNGPDPALLPPPGPERTGYMLGFYLAAVSVVIITTCYQGLILYGAWNLLQHRSRTMALVGSAMCCVPCCSPLLIQGIPFGIAGIVITNQLADEGEFQM